MSYYSYLEELFAQMQSKKNAQPDKSYTAYLCGLNSEAVSKKFMEEAFELAIANIEMVDSKGREELIGEACDAIYHLMVILISKNIDFEEVLKEMKNRDQIKKIDAINFKKN